MKCKSGSMLTLAYTQCQAHRDQKRYLTANKFFKYNPTGPTTNTMQLIRIMCLPCRHPDVGSRDCDWINHSCSNRSTVNSHRLLHLQEKEGTR